MNKLVILFSLVAVVVAEPPSNYGAPQQYSAPSFYSAPSTGYSDGGEDSFVDSSLLARISQILEQSSSSNGYASSSYGPPSSGYGAPSRSSAGVILGRPEVAQRIAEFDLESTRSAGYSSGGYSSGGY